MKEPSIDQLAQAVNFTLPEQYNASRLLWDNLPEHASKTAILHDAGSWSYAALAEEAARIGHYLRRYSEPGDRVLLLMDDEPAYPAAIMGAMRAGLVPILTNTLSPVDLIEFFLEDSAASAAIVSTAFKDMLPDSVIAELLCQIVAITAERPWADEKTQLDEYPTSRRDAAFWMYSSGSTGRPKGVIHRHEDAPYTARTYAADVLQLGPEDICFSIPKIFFAYGFGNSVTFPMSRAAAVVLLSGRPTPERVFETIARFKPTAVFGLPTLYTALMHSEAVKDADLSSVRLCLSAAEILSEEISSAWKARFGLSIIEGLGSTEMLHIYLSNDQKLQKSGSAGRVVPGYAIKLMTAEGRQATVGEEGVMYVRGLSGLESYWNRPDKTAETVQDSWIMTGDRFVMDEDGYYFFKGRADDLVKVSGQWVYPLEIELTLNEHPQVKESCVQAIALADQRLTLKAWVSLVDGAEADASMTRELQNFAKHKLLPHKYPREVVYLDTLPKTGSDKIDRQALRKMS